MVIHTIGDSHSYAGWNLVSNHVFHHLGPKLCYSFSRDGIDISSYNILPEDIVVFCLGEIDCRCHIHKYISPTKSYKDIIDNIINNYFITIKRCTEKIKLKNICVYNVVPPIQKYNTRENKDYPYLGTDNERKSYVLYFNEKLKEKCKDYNYIFFDVYDKYIDDGGVLNKNLSDDNVHIKNGIHIKEFIDKNLNLIN